MRISIDANEANQKLRVGSGQYAYNLIKHFAQAKDSFHLFLKDQELNDLPKSPNFTYHVVRPKKFWKTLSLPFHLATHNYDEDIFFSPAHYSPSYFRGKLVVTIHDLAYEKFPELFLKSDLYKLKNWTLSSLNKATRVIAVSEATKKDIVKYYKTDASKISVVHNGYDKTLFNSKVKENRKLLEKYEIPKQKYLLYVGTIQPRKNVTRLVQAFHLLKDSGSYDGNLVIAGNPGWMAEESLTAIRQSSYANDIIMTGYVTQNDLPQLYKSADLYILPSLMEGFGIPLLESMAVGTPALAANNSSLPEVLGDAGILFNPYDPADIAESIKKALSMRQKLAEKSLSQASKFSWQKSATETLRVFRLALDS